MRPLRCSIVMSDHGRSKWMRWWHCAVEVDALGGDVAGEEQPDRALGLPELLDDVHAASASARPACSTRTCRRARARAARGARSASQSRVAMRSEKTTTRVGDVGPTPMLLELGRRGGRASTRRRRRSPRRSRSSRASAASSRMPLAASLCRRAASVRLRAVRDRLGERAVRERNALSSVQGKSLRP